MIGPTVRSRSANPKPLWSKSRSCTCAPVAGSTKWITSLPPVWAGWRPCAMATPTVAIASTPAIAADSIICLFIFPPLLSGFVYQFCSRLSPEGAKDSPFDGEPSAIYRDAAAIGRQKRSRRSVRMGDWHDVGWQRHHHRRQAFAPGFGPWGGPGGFPGPFFGRGARVGRGDV